MIPHAYSLDPRQRGSRLWLAAKEGMVPRGRFYQEDSKVGLSPLAVRKEGETSLSLATRRKKKRKGTRARQISMPSVVPR